ncbi:alpha/beta hydrolase [Spirillospora sp. NPDC029432]|uniref:alpha/beta hydrolase n=1 Tax=Spirillospora sp. NPDC029432 TaxID=3154599 RepID=UPI003453F7F0
MPIGYLITAALAAALVFVPLTPLRFQGFLGVMALRLGLVSIELPLLPLYWLTASTLIAVAQDDLAGPVGWTAFALVTLTVAMLVVFLRRGLQARALVERYAGEKPPLSIARHLAGGLYMRRRGVERVANIRYGDAGDRNLLDVYRHRSHPANAPTLVYWHGGGYYSGRKNREARSLLHRLASQGWVCVSANYRLRPSATFTDHLVDAKKAIAWVREHGHAYGADPATVFVAGGSAGAHMASIAALTPNEPALQPGFDDADTSVSGAICLYGYYGNYYGLDEHSSPMAHIHRDAPPFFLAHGDRDSMVPVESARLFADRLRDASAQPVAYLELPGAQHSFDLFHSLRFEAVIHAIETFTARVRGTRSQTTELGGDQTTTVAPQAIHSTRLQKNEAH